MTKTYQAYVEHMQKTADLHHVLAVLGWDKEVHLPIGGSSFRARQMATVSGMAHELFTNKEFGVLMLELNHQTSLNTEEKRNIELSLKDYDRSTKFEKSFVEQKSKLVSKAYQAWLNARAENNFNSYITPLQELIDISREEAEILGYEDHAYDAMLDLYEPGLSVKMLQQVFSDFHTKLSPLLDKLSAAPQPDDTFLKNFYAKDVQWEFGLKVLKEMGYDFNHGRQDISPHPFTTSFSPQDVRVTTRVDEHDIMNMLMSCIHEGGHALYEQGLNPAYYGLPLGQAASLGVHESQSRLWENHVGRSLAFWEHWFPLLQGLFKDALKGISLESFYRGINKVTPSPIRTEADELTYHFHVLIRYEIEKSIFEGDLNAVDLKDAWNEKYHKHLGLKGLSDNEGILQDVHWSHGSFGYFPTYSLGSFYAAQFFARAEQTIPNMNAKIQIADYKDLLDWLRNHIHQFGRQFEAEDLCKNITNEALNVDHFASYAVQKYSDIYQLI